ncbi:hypothetical protein KDD17_02065 [Sulfitobacter albidus]|uniref:DUF3303 domain-containing protein n=1 Tax=Sulfitobacter albidus TaxID=2829501 RepID=A0A975JEP0_9RHOB|nr:hypothetical protein [Sulfitobacter albidus]QUJ76870.1 hypothetical protein KDD17_02065 [Sulfitobacter albidus]
MQLICEFEVTGFDDWKRAFDADEEARRNAGLGVLQVWRAADDSARAFVLLAVNDRGRANDWIARSNALSLDDGGTVNSASHHFIETA